MAAAGHFLHYICDGWAETGFDERPHAVKTAGDGRSVLKQAIKRQRWSTLWQSARRRIRHRRLKVAAAPKQGQDDDRQGQAD